MAENMPNSVYMVSIRFRMSRAYQFILTNDTQNTINLGSRKIFQEREVIRNKNCIAISKTAVPFNNASAITA